MRVRLPFGLLAYALVGLASLACGAASAQAVRAVTEATPYTVQMPDGRVGGPAADIVDRTLARAGFKDYSISLYPWPRSYALATQEPNVLIFPLGRNADREKQFQWVASLLRTDYRFYTLPDRKDIRIASLADARAFSVGVVRDDVRHQYLKAQGFQRLVVSADTGENFRRLLNRQVDMVPLSDMAAKMQCEQAGADCPGLQRVFTMEDIGAEFYMAYSLDTPPAVVQRTRAAFEALRAEGALMRVSTEAIVPTGPRAAGLPR